jgi:hypothetical protein
MSSRTMVSDQRPTLFLKMRLNRADAMDRRARAANPVESIVQRLAEQGINILGAIRIDPNAIEGSDPDAFGPVPGDAKKH